MSKVNSFSKYLKKKNPLVKKLVSELDKYFEFASVLATDVKAKSYAVDRSSIMIRPSNICECGFVARVFKDNVYSEYSFNELKENNIDNIVNAIKDLSEKNIKTKKVNAKLIDEEKIEQSFERKAVGHTYTDEELVDLLTELKNYGFSLDERILNVQVAFERADYSKMYISKNKDLEQYYVYNNYRSFVLMRGTEEQGMKYAYDGFGGNDPKKEFKLLKKSLEENVELASNLLSATIPTPGVYTIVTDPSITGLIAHEAFGHGLEMDMFVKDRAKSQEYMNKMVASPLVTMHDGAASAFSAGSYFFDDEGAIASDTVIIDKGKLVGGICDSISASQLNYHPTGNGRRESYKRKAYTRMTNTFFDCGESTLEDIIKSVDYGFYVAQTNNGMEDPKNWGIQCTALYGKEIKDGKFTGKYVSPVVMSGYVIDLLESISMVSNNKIVCGSGSCGKGYKEWVRVADGGASIKATVKVG